MYRNFKEYMNRVNQTARKTNPEEIRLRLTDDYIECMKMVGVKLTCPEKYVCLKTNEDGDAALPPDWMETLECKVDGCMVFARNRFARPSDRYWRGEISLGENSLHVLGGGIHKIELVYYGLPHDPACGEFLIPEMMYEGVVLYAESEQLRIRAQVLRQYENTMSPAYSLHSRAMNRLTWARGKMQRIDNPTLRAIKDASRLHFYDGINSFGSNPGYMYSLAPAYQIRTGYEATANGMVPSLENHIVDMSLYDDNEKLKDLVAKLEGDIKSFGVIINNFISQVGTDVAGKMDFKQVNDFVEAEAICTGSDPFMLLIKDDGTGRPIMAYYNGMSAGAFNELVDILHDPSQELVGGPVEFVSASTLEEFNAATSGFVPRIIDYRDNGLYRYYINFDMNPIIERILSYEANV